VDPQHRFKYRTSHLPRNYFANFELQHSIQAYSLVQALFGFIFGSKASLNINCQMFAIKFKDDKKLCIFGYFHLYNSTEVISHLTSFNEDQYSVVANFLIIICQVD